VTAKHNAVAVLVVGRPIACKATDASLDETVDGRFGLRVGGLAVRMLVVLLVVEEQ